MNLMESLSVAFESLSANKMRAALTMLGIIIGVSAVITMLAIAQGARQKMMSNIQQMGTNVLTVRSGQSRSGAVMGGFGSTQTLTLEDADAIKKKCRSVARCSPDVSSNAQVKYKNQNTNTSIVGTNPDYLIIRNFKIQKGKFFTNSDVRSARKVAVVGPTTATNLFGEVSPIGKTLRIKGIPFLVIGTMAPKGSGGFMDPDDQIYIPVSTAMRRVFGLKYVRSISVEAKSMDVMNEASAEIEQLMRKRHHIAKNEESDVDIRNQADIMAMADQFSGIFTLLLGGIASVSLLVGGIGIMNIMLVSVTERTREIGIRMALGARRKDIERQFLVEALVLSLLGGIIGIILGMLTAFIASKVSSLSASVTLASILMSFGFATLVGIFFGYYPARQAANLDPIDALRYE